MDVVMMEDGDGEVVVRTDQWRPWENLHEDVLGLMILPRLTSLVDRIRFSATCKSWRSASADYIRPKSPWIFQNVCHPGVLMGDHDTHPLLYEPYNMTPYPLLKKDDGDGDGDGLAAAEITKLLSRSSLLGSRFGWILLYSRRVVGLVDFVTGMMEYHYHVYNPLTKQIISLPEYKIQRKGNARLQCVTFTADPTSPHCQFIALYHSLAHDCDRVDVYISSCSSNTKGGAYRKWRTRNITPPLVDGDDQRYYLRNSCKIMVDGVGAGERDNNNNIIVYCLSYNGALTSFNVGTGKWSILVAKWSTGILAYSDSEIFSYRKLVAYGGHLYFVIVEDDDCSVYRLDKVHKIWEKIDRLLEGGGLLLFVGHEAGLPFGMSAEELRGTKMGDAAVGGNRVYYFTSYKSGNTNNVRFRPFGGSHHLPSTDEGDLLVFPDGTPYGPFPRRIWMFWS